MVNQCAELLPEESVRVLLDVIAPGSVLLMIDSLPGSFSNYTHLVEARSSDGSAFRVVVRRYAVGHVGARLVRLLETSAAPPPGCGASG